MFSEIGNVAFMIYRLFNLHGFEHIVTVRRKDELKAASCDLLLIIKCLLKAKDCCLLSIINKGKLVEIDFWVKV